MPRFAFYSFCYKDDIWRVNQVAKMGIVDGEKPVNPNEFEKIKRNGERAIAAWINANMDGTSITIVLIGSRTASRPWIKYEINRTWNVNKKALLGIHIHGLKDSNQNESSMGANPFSEHYISTPGFFGQTTRTSLASIVPCHNPFGLTSSGILASIKEKLPEWAEEAIKIREKYA